MKTEKIRVCVECESTDILDTSCRCMDNDYPTVELEFQVCECCDRLYDDPLDNEFNHSQRAKAWWNGLRVDQRSKYKGEDVVKDYEEYCEEITKRYGLST